jgi:hypothetical protein
VRREAGDVRVLPEVRPTVHPNVECAIHPGKTVGGVAICVHVLDGAPVYLKAEPDQEHWGAVLCEECAEVPREHMRLRLACVKCVRYHFSPEEEMAAHQNVSDLDLFSMAETEGLRSYCSVRDGSARQARCPFETAELRWAWNMGFRLARYLDECKQALSQALAAEGETGSA